MYFSRYFEPINELISPTLIELKERIVRGDLTALDNFWEIIKREGNPIVEDIPDHLRENIPLREEQRRLITFVLNPRLRHNPVYFIPIGFNITDNSKDLEFNPLGDPIEEELSLSIEQRINTAQKINLLFRSFLVHKDARIMYSICDGITPQFNKKGDIFDRYEPFFINDPYNIEFTDIYKSILQMPEAQKDIKRKYDHMNLSRKMRRYIGKSTELNEIFSYYVYLPPDYSEITEKLPCMVFLEGNVYKDQFFIQRMLDDLISTKQLSPCIAVLISNWPTTIQETLCCNPDYASFIANELLPDLKRKFNIRLDHPKNTICGFNLGGVMAGYIAMNNPQIFKNVIMQSSPVNWSKESFDASGHLQLEFQIRRRLPLRFYIDVSTYEPIVKENRIFKNMLIEKGYEVMYHESFGAHHPISWRNLISNGFRFILMDEVLEQDLIL